MISDQICFKGIYSIIKTILRKELLLLNEYGSTIALLKKMYTQNSENNDFPSPKRPRFINSSTDIVMVTVFEDFVKFKRKIFYRYLIKRRSMMSKYNPALLKRKIIKKCSLIWKMHQFNFNVKNQQIGLGVTFKTTILI